MQRMNGPWVHQAWDRFRPPQPRLGPSHPPRPGVMASHKGRIAAPALWFLPPFLLTHGRFKPFGNTTFAFNW